MLAAFKQPELIFQALKNKVDFPQKYSSELFLLAKLGNDSDAFVVEIQEIAKKHFSKDFQKALLAKKKYPKNAKTIDDIQDFLIKAYQTCNTLDIGKLYHWLGYDSIFIFSSKKKEISEHIGLFRFITRFEINSDFRVLPDSVKHWTNLEVLDLKGLEKFPPLAPTAKKLELDLSKMAEFPEELLNFELLEELELTNQSNKKTFQLPADFHRLKALKKLRMLNINIESIPTNFTWPENLESLDICRCSGFQTLPEGLSKLKNLQSIEIYYCDDFTKIPEELACSPTLNHLEYKSENPVELPISIFGLESLEVFKIEVPEIKAVGNIKAGSALKKIRITNMAVFELFLSLSTHFSQIEEIFIDNISQDLTIPDTFIHFKNLKKLIIVATVTGFSDQIQNLEHLEVLSFSELKTTCVLKTLKSLKTLVINTSYPLDMNDLPIDGGFSLEVKAPELIVSTCACQSIHWAFTKLTNEEKLIELKQLEKLYFHGHQMLQIPDALFKIPALKAVHLVGNFEKLPDSFSDCTTLEEIRLDSGYHSYSVPIKIPLKELPKDWSNLKNLKSLNIHNYIGSDVEFLCSLKHVERLELWFCSGLKELPGNIKNLDQLKEINLFSCENLKTLHLPKNLQKLNIEHNHAINDEEIEKIADLKELRSLKIGYLKCLNKLPEGLKNLPNLDCLQLRSLEMKTLPEWLGEMQQLKTLGIEGFYIQTLPDSIGNLKNLEVMIISGSSFEYLPESFANLELKTVVYWQSKFSGNNMKSEVYNILLKPGTQLKDKWDNH